MVLCLTHDTETSIKRGKGIAEYIYSLAKFTVIGISTVTGMMQELWEKKSALWYCD